MCIAQVYKVILALPWSDIALLLSAVFVGLTWFVAKKQLTALNRATQMQNFIVLAQEMDSQRFSQGYGFVWNLRNKSLSEKRTRLAEDAATDDPQFDRVANYIERVAYLANHDLLESKIAMDWWGVIADDIIKSVGDFIEESSKTDPGFCSELRKFVNKVNAYWDEFGRSSASR